MEYILCCRFSTPPQPSELLLLLPELFQQKSLLNFLNIELTRQDLFQHQDQASFFTGKKIGPAELPEIPFS